jgi:hypothetical protein
MRTTKSFRLGKGEGTKLIDRVSRLCLPDCLVGVGPTTESHKNVMSKRETQNAKPDFIVHYTKNS